MSVARLLLTLGVAAYGLAAAGNGIDRVSRMTPALERAVPAPFRAQADRSAAETALVRQDIPAMLASARGAVRADPVDVDASSLLGTALLLTGQANAADRAFRVAARFGWRNVATQGYWYDASLKAGDFELASERADAILRVHPRLVDSTALLEPLERSDAGRRVLAERLSASPPWKKNYLYVRLDAPTDLVRRRLLVLSAIGPQRPLGCDAVARFTSVLLQQGLHNDAVTFWNRNCPASAVAGPMTDLTFRSLTASAVDLPFAWVIEPSGDVTVEQMKDGSGSPSLSLVNSGSITRLALHQQVGFAPGTYRFRFVPAAGAVSPAGALAVSWTCGDQPSFPETGRGDPLRDGQVVQVGACDRQSFGLWLTGGGATIKVRSIDFQKIG